jgi:hypothetical protein
MSSQIFKKEIPKKALFDLLEINCIHNETIMQYECKKDQINIVDTVDTGNVDTVDTVDTGDTVDTKKVKKCKCLVFNKNAYKRGIFNDSIPQFLEFCKDYYNHSKKKYLERKLSYTSFVTVLRQICNLHKITYTSKIHYEKSMYEIVYYIYP